MIQLVYTGRSPWGDRGVALSSSRPTSEREVVGRI